MIFCNRCKFYHPGRSVWHHENLLWECHHQSNILGHKYDNMRITKTIFKSKAKKINKNNDCINFEER